MKNIYKKLTVNSDEVAFPVNVLLNEIYDMYDAGLDKSDIKKAKKLINITNKLLDILFIKPYLSYGKIQLTELEANMLNGLIEGNTQFNEIINDMKKSDFEYKNLTKLGKAFIYFYAELKKSLGEYESLVVENPNIDMCRKKYAKQYVDKYIFIYEKQTEIWNDYPLLYFFLPPRGFDQTSCKLFFKYKFSHNAYYRSEKQIDKAYKTIEKYRENPIIPVKPYSEYDNYEAYEQAEEEFEEKECELQEANDMLDYVYGPGWRCLIYNYYASVNDPESDYYECSEQRYVEDYIKMFEFSKAEIKVFTKYKHIKEDSKFDSEYRTPVLNLLFKIRGIANKEGYPSV